MEGPKEAGVDGCRGEQEAARSRGLTRHLRIKQPLQVMSALTLESRTAGPPPMRTASPLGLGWVPPTLESQLITTQVERSPKSQWQRGDSKLGSTFLGLLTRRQRLCPHTQGDPGRRGAAGRVVATAHSPWK